MVTPAAAAAASAVATSEGGGASPLSLANKRGRGRDAGAASATAAAIKSATSTPPREGARKLPPGHGGGPAPEEMGRLDDDDELCFEPYVDDVEDGQDGQPNLHGTAEVVKCLYAKLFGNEKPTKPQMMAEGERATTSSEIEEDAQRVEERLLISTPSPQDF